MKQEWFIVKGITQNACFIMVQTPNIMSLKMHKCALPHQKQQECNAHRYTSIIFLQRTRLWSLQSSLLGQVTLAFKT